MIHTNRTVTVGNQESTIDGPIILYRGDKEIEVEFSIVGNKFTFKNKGNVIESSNASSGQLVILTPYGGRLFSDKSECRDGKVIADWIADGGVHIANFAGHEHSDMIGYTKNGVLNMICQCATNDESWVDAARVEGTKTFDCFNFVSVETTTGVFKVVRIGNNSDHYLREKKVFAYDYINKKILTK